MSEFEKATENVKKLNNISNENKLKLYALYKQATLGNNTNSKPNFWDRVGIAKWNAWNDVKDIKKDVAENRYVEIVNKLLKD